MNTKIRVLIGAAVCLTVYIAGSAYTPKAASHEPILSPAPISAAISQDSSKAQAAADGTVLVADNLNIDFSKHLVTFIELGADKCIPCKAMQPIMKEIAAEYKGQVQVVFYDVWKNPEPGRKYGIQLIPTQVFMDKNGKELFRHTGLFPKPDLVKFLKKQGVR
jgi:thioredoxin 1